MPSIFIRHRVRDFAVWKPLFDEHEPARRKHGLVGHKMYRGADDSNEITVVFETRDLERSKEFGSSEDLRSAMEQAGVEGVPEVWYAEDVEEKRHAGSGAETEERVGASA